MVQRLAVALVATTLVALSGGQAQASSHAPKCKILSTTTVVEVIPSAGPGADPIEITTTTTRSRCRGKIVTTVERTWR